MAHPTREAALAAVKSSIVPPDGNPKTAQGLKKPPLISVIPTTALLQIGAVMRTGKEKYGAYNWRDYPVTTSTYIDAAMRHLIQYWDGETVDPESGLPHLAHAAASLMVIMDALATGNATDDRPAAGVSGELIRLYASNDNGGFTPPAPTFSEEERRAFDELIERPTSASVFEQPFITSMVNPSWIGDEGSGP